MSLLKGAYGCSGSKLKCHPLISFFVFPTAELLVANWDLSSSVFKEKVVPFATEGQNVLVNVLCL